MHAQHAARRLAGLIIQLPWLRAYIHTYLHTYNGTYIHNVHMWLLGWACLGRVAASARLGSAAVRGAPYLWALGIHAKAVPPGWILSRPSCWNWRYRVGGTRTFVFSPSVRALAPP